MQFIHFFSANSTSYPCIFVYARKLLSHLLLCTLVLMFLLHMEVPASLLLNQSSNELGRK